MDLSSLLPKSIYDVCDISDPEDQYRESSSKEREQHHHHHHHHNQHHQRQDSLSDNMSSWSSYSSSSSVGSSASSSPLQFHHRVHSPSHSHSDSDRVGDEVQIIRTWFSVLNDDERLAALSSISEMPSLREIEPMIQALKDRKRELWRRQEELLIQPNARPRWPMPSFPQNSQDPRWLTKWLRALRLHKYEKCLTGLSPAQVAELDEDRLQNLGIDTVGARTKLLRVGQRRLLLINTSISRILTCAKLFRMFRLHHLSK